MDLADTPANEHAYGRPGTATDLKSSYPQARVLGLVECGTHAVTGAVVSGSSASGHELYPGLLHRLEEDMLAMADRGFFSYTAGKDRAGIGAALLWWVRANAVLPVLEEVEDGSYLSAVYPTPKARRNNYRPRARDRPFLPKRLAEAFTAFCQEILNELLPSRRQRTNPRVIKRKMPNWPLKRLPRKPK
ncbi:UNVERIFIED_ORG: hypothetical protein ABIB21_001266 [Arthrobacter sp. UYEF13]